MWLQHCSVVASISVNCKQQEVGVASDTHCSDDGCVERVVDIPVQCSDVSPQTPELYFCCGSQAGTRGDRAEAS